MKRSNDVRIIFLFRSNDRLGFTGRKQNIAIQKKYNKQTHKNDVNDLDFIEIMPNFVLRKQSDSLSL